jgi:hypothetical protein
VSRKVRAIVIVSSWKRVGNGTAGSVSWTIGFCRVLTILRQMPGCRLVPF